MSDQEIVVKISAKNLTESEFKAARQQISGLGDELDNVTRKGDALKFAFAGWANEALKFASDGIKHIAEQLAGLAIEGSKAIGIEDTFKRLAQAAGVDAVDALDRMKKASRGLIDDTQLMVKMNGLLGSGMKLTSEDMATLASAARSVAKSMGVDVAQGFDIVAGALTSGRVQGLRMAGVMVDLTNTSARLKKQMEAEGLEMASATEIADRRAAILQGLRKATAEAGDSELSLAERVQQAKVAFGNTLEDLGKAIAKSPALLQAWDEIADAVKDAFGPNSEILIKKIVNTIENVVQFARDAVQWIRNLPQPIKDMVLALAKIAIIGAPVIVTGQAIKTVYDKVSDGLKTVSSVASSTGQNLTKVIEKIQAMTKSWEGLPGPLGKAHTALQGLATFLTGPWGLALALAAGAFVTLKAKQDAYFDSLTRQMDRIKQAAELKRDIDKAFGEGASRAFDPMRMKDEDIARLKDLIKTTQDAKTGQLGFKIQLNETGTAAKEAAKDVALMTDAQIQLTKRLRETSEALASAFKRGVPTNVIVDKFGSDIKSLIADAQIYGMKVGSNLVKGLFLAANQELNAQAAELAPKIAKTLQDEAFKRNEQNLDTFITKYLDANKKKLDADEKYYATWKEYQEMVETRSMSDLDAQLERIKREGDERLASLDKTARGYEDMYAYINLITNERLVQAVYAHDDATRKMVADAMAVKSAWQEAFDNLPGIITGALQGGGNVLGSIGQTLGGALFSKGSPLTGLIGGKVFAPIANALGGGLGAAFMQNAMSFIPVIGSALGPLISKGLGALGNALGFTNQTKGARESFAKNLGFGDLGQLYDTLRGLGKEGEKLANIGLNVIGKKDTAANERWMKDVEKLLADTEKLNQAVQQYGLSWRDLADPVKKHQGMVEEANALIEQTVLLTQKGGYDYNTVIKKMADPLNDLLRQALETGTKLPKDMRGMIEALIKTGSVADDVKRKLLGIPEETKVPWQDMQSVAEKYGISLEALGPKFQAAKLGDLALEYANDFNLLVGNGADLGAVIEAMKPKIQEVVTAALTMGLELPAAMKPVLQKFLEMGALTDANGDKLENLDNIKFGVDLNAAFSNLIDKIDELIDRLVEGLYPAIENIPSPPDFDPSRPGRPSRPGESGGSGNGGDSGDESQAPGSASGGLFARPALRVIAEQRPEVVGTPSVIVNAMAEAMKQAGGGFGGAVTVQFNVHAWDSTDVRRAMPQVARALVDELKHNPATRVQAQRVIIDG